MKKCFSLVCALLMLVSSLSLNVIADAVEPAGIENAQIKFDKASYTYTGSAIEPSVKVTLDGAELVKDTDYSVAFSENVNVGSGVATFKGLGKYSGEVTKNFSITQIRIANSKAEFIRTAESTVGKAPAYTVKFNGKTLKKGVDYNVTVSGIEKAGIKTGTIQFQGIGNFNNVKTIKFNVYPKKVKGLGTKSRKTTSFKIKWKSQKDDGVDGYKVYSCDNKGRNPKLLEKVGTNSVKIKSLESGKYYYYVVRAYKTGDGKTIYGEYSDVFKGCTKPEKIEIKSVGKTSSKKKLSIKWSKVSCSGYEVQYSTDKKFKKKVKTVVVSGSTNTSKKINIPSNDKTYYARVRAYRKYNGNKTIVHGEWSIKFSTDYSNVYAHYSCHYPNKPARNNNLRIACKAINGTVIYPGEVFSFNRVVGQRTSSKGYRPAPIFQGATVVRDGVGGGVCQVASTVFNTALYANFDIVERHQHSQRVHYGTLGRDATVFWGSQDFKFRNTCDYPIKIKMWLEDQRVNCYFYTCYDVKPKKVKLNVTQSGKHFKLTRTAGGKVNYVTHSYY